MAATPGAVKNAVDTVGTALLKHYTDSSSDNYRPHIAYEVAENHDGNKLVVNADTLGGLTIEDILDEAKAVAGGGTSTVTGTIDYTTGNPNNNAQGVTLRNAANTSVHILPKTTAANVIDLDTKLSGYVKFAVGAEPTKALGTIWFDGSSAPYKIKIWNGSAWEVMNSWQ